MSLPEQKRRIEESCSQDRYRLVETFYDRRLRGLTETRQQFQELMRYVRNPANVVKAVVVYGR